jgi:acetyl-CoA carboxylase biotin carboxyl carrier protein
MRLDDIRRLIELVGQNDIAEIEVRDLFTRVRISKIPANGAVPTVHLQPSHAAAVPVALPTPPPALPSPEAQLAPSPAESTDHLVPITAPMVGTFYRAPAPDAEAYVEQGAMVEVGQTVCIIEAMKLMNEIESEVRGRVEKILVPNASPVEFGQPLFLIDASAR